MKILFAVILSLMLLASGCQTYDLDPEWAPLVKVVELDNLPFFSDSTTTTVSPRIFVKDLDKWLETNPPGSVKFIGLMRHEREHARRQEAYPGGTKIWIGRYLSDKDFRWQEEQAGYREAILYYRSRNYRVIPEVYAKILSGKSYGNMVTYEEALAWVRNLR